MPFPAPRIRQRFPPPAFALIVAAATIALVSVVSVHAQSATPEPQDYRRLDDQNPYAGSFADLERDIDRFWSDAFHKARIAYAAPTVVTLDRAMSTGCGRRGPERVAFYCPIDQSIYLNPEFVAEQETTIGDFAPIIVLAHEWGHHVQQLLRVVDLGGNAYELQADCLAGVFTRDAEEQGLLEPGDFLEALEMSESVGDPAWFPQDQPGAHGSYADRRNAVMRGYLDGAVGCGLELGAPSTRTPTPAQVMERPDLFNKIVMGFLLGTRSIQP